MRKLVVILFALAAACTSEVAPKNPFDPATAAQGQARARVRGTLAAPGLPSAQGLLVVLKTNNVLRKQVFTGADGTFALDELLPGGYALESAPQGYLPLVVPLTLQGGDDLDLGTLTLTEQAGADLSFITGMATLAGEASHEGTLVEAVGRAFTTQTDVAGGFRLLVVEGTYDLRFTHKDYVTLSLSGVSIGKGQEKSLEPVALASNPATVRGHVEAEKADGGRGPLVDAAVTLVGTAITGFTGVTGDFTLTGVPAGSYLVRVVKTGYVSGAAVPVLDLAGGETRVLDEEIVLALSKGALAGTVRLADSADASGIVVELTGAGQAEVTGSNGRFEFPELIAGSYEVAARRDGYARRVLGTFNVTEGSTRDVGSFTLARQGGAVSIEEAPYTRTRTVTLALAATGAVGFHASEDPLFADRARGDTASDAWRPVGAGEGTDFTLADADGEHEVFVVFFDGANASTPASARVVLDRTRPTAPSVIIGAGTRFSNAQGGLVTLDLSAQDLPPSGTGAAVSGLSQVHLAHKADFAGAVILDYNRSATWALDAATTDGPKAVYARFTDHAGNVSDAASATVILDRRAPSSAAIGLSGPDGRSDTTRTPVVTATLSASDAYGGAGNVDLLVRLSNTPGFVGARYGPFAPDVTWFLSPGDGAKTVHAQIMDAAGNESLAVFATILLDSAGPTSPSVIIEDTDARPGNGYTNRAGVRLRLVAAGAPVRALVGEDAALVGAISVNLVGQTLPHTVPFTLGGPGQRTVWARYFDAAGNLSDLTAASIVLDQTAPSAALPTLVPARHSPSAAIQLVPPSAGQDDVLLSGAVASPSGYVAAPAGVPIDVTLSPGNGPRALTATWRDLADNTTAVALPPVIVDAQPPSVANFAVTGALADGSPSTARTVTTAVTVDFSAQTDLVSGITEMKVSNLSSLADAAWESFVVGARAVPWRLSGGDGTKTVYARFRDAAGIESVTVNGTIELDTAPPSAPGIDLLEGDSRASNGYTNRSTVVVRLTAGGSPVRAQVSEDPAFADTVSEVDMTGLPQPVARGFTLAGVGLRTVWARYFDAAGNVSSEAAALVTVDQSAPAAAAFTLIPAGFTTVASIKLVPPSADQDALSVSGTGVSAPLGFVAAPAGAPIDVTLAGGNGTKTFTVVYQDLADNTSAPVPGSIVLDAQAPSVASFTVRGVLGDGSTSAAFAASSGVLLDFSAQTDVVSGLKDMKVSNLASLADAEWTGFVGSSALPWSLPAGDGAKTIHARFRDRAGVESVTVSGSIDLRATPPSGGSLVIDGGADTTTDGAVGLTLLATSAAQMLVSIDGVPLGEGWVSYAASKQVDLGSSEGRRVVSVLFRNQARVEGGGASASILYDRTAPLAGTLTLIGSLGNGSTDAGFSSTPAVVARVAPAGGQDVAQMALVQAPAGPASCIAALAAPVWQPFAPTSTFVLSGPNESKRVCVVFRDAAGNYDVGAYATATLVLDTTPPANPIFNNLASGTTFAPNAPAAGNPTVSNSSDNLPGPVTFQCNGGTSYQTWTDCGTSTTLPQAYALRTNKENTIGVRARDAAYNYSSGTLLRIVHDDVPPATPSSLRLRGSLATGQSSDVFTTSPAIAAEVALPADAREMAVRQAQGACPTLLASAAWQPVSLTSTIVLSGTDGPKQVCLKIRDEAGNESADAISDSIVLDTTAPANPVFLNLESQITSSLNVPENDPRITVSTDNQSTVTYQCIGGQGHPEWWDCAVDPLLVPYYLNYPNAENWLGIRARDDAFNTSEGTMVRVIHDSTPPHPPNITSVRSSETSVSLSWTASASADVVGYRLNYGNRPGDVGGTGAAQGPSPVDVGAARSYELSGLTPGVTYYLSVVAVDAAGLASDPSGERVAVPDKVNPRLLSAFGANLTAVSAVKDTPRVILAQHQGLIQLDISSDTGIPTLTGRATLPNLIPEAKAGMPVMSGLHTGYADVVFVTGHTLEGDFRNDHGAARAGVSVVRFPASGSAQDPVVGSVVARLSSQAEALVLSDASTTLFTVERTRVTAYDVRVPSAPAKILSRAYAGVAGGVDTVYGAGLAGNTLYVLARPTAASSAQIYAFNVAALPSTMGTSGYPAPRTSAGQYFGSRGSFWNETEPFLIIPSAPVEAASGGIYIGYNRGPPAGPFTHTLSRYAPGLAGFPDPTSSTDLFVDPDGNDGSGRLEGPPTWVDTSGASDRLYLFCGGCLPAEQQGYQVTVLGDSYSVRKVPFQGQSDRLISSAVATISSERLLAIDLHRYNVAPLNQPNQSLRRWNTAGSNLAPINFPYADGRGTVLAEGNDNVYVARGLTLTTMDVSNPMLPQQTGQLDAAATGPMRTSGNYGLLLAHGHYVFAGVQAPSGVGSGGVDVYRHFNTSGTLAYQGRTPATTAAMPIYAMAISGRYLFLGRRSTAPGVTVYNLNIPSAPVHVVRSGTLWVTALDVRANTIYAADENGYFQVFDFDGSTVTTVSSILAPPANFTSFNTRHITARGDLAVLSDYSQSFAVNVANPAFPFYYTTNYPVAGPVALQGGYVIGLDPYLGDVESSPTLVAEGGPRFISFTGGAIDGTMPFSTCGPSIYDVYANSLLTRGGMYFASCNRNGTQIVTPVDASGGRLLKRNDDSWNDLASPLASDGMYTFLGGQYRSGGSATLWHENEQLMSWPYSTPSTPVFNTSSTAVPRSMTYADGKLYVVMLIGSDLSVHAYDVSDPGSVWPLLATLGTGNYALSSYPPVHDEDYLYVEADPNTLSGRIHVINIRSPTTLAVADTITDIPATTRFAGMALHRQRLYAARNLPSPAIITVWNVATPTNVTHTGMVDITFPTNPPAQIHDIHVSGRWLFYTYSGPSYTAPYGLGLVRLSLNRDGNVSFGADSESYGRIFESPLPLGSPTVVGDTLYLRHNLGVATFDLTPLWAAYSKPIYLGSQGHNEALFPEEHARFFVDGPWAYLLGGSYRVFDLR